MRHRGQLTRQSRQPFLHALPRVEQIGCRLENQHDRGQAEDGLRANRAHTRHAAHDRFNRHADEGFDFRRGQPGRFGLDFDDGWRELRKDVERNLLHLPEAEENPASDYVAVAEGYVSLTPLKIDRTNHDLAEAMASWPASLFKEAIPLTQ